MEVNTLWVTALTLCTWRFRLWEQVSPICLKQILTCCVRLLLNKSKCTITTWWKMSSSHEIMFNWICVIESLARSFSNPMLNSSPLQKCTYSTAAYIGKTFLNIWDTFYHWLYFIQSANLPERIIKVLNSGSRFVYKISSPGRKKFSLNCQWLLLCELNSADIKLLFR